MNTSTTASSTITSTPTPTATTSRFALGRARTRLLALLLATVGVLGLTVAGAGSASANAANNQDICWHTIGTRTLISETLPAGNGANQILDTYLYRYNGSAWVFTGVSERLRGTTAGYWVHPSGMISNASGYQLVKGTGYYVIRNHMFSATNPSLGAWFYEIGYADDLRGATSYCYA
ncbi:hypothetical protein [Intrasporangium flavum]|uniref:hypothetical protein n=1 Tax=Intrasporangium flavum TaxID=1428657 RepID=UPI00096E8A86|nr:hypothetical protein [Intrasporangium flavum]